MNKLAPVFLILAVAFGTFGFYEQQRAATFRARVEELESAAANAHAESAANVNQLEKLKDQASSQKAAIEQLEAHNRELASAPAAAKTEATGEKASGNDYFKGIAKMFDDPKTREAMRAQQIAQVSLMYSSFAKEAGLAPDVARQVLALLGDRQADMAAKGMAAMSRDGKDMAVVGQETNAVKRSYDDQLKAVLGDEGFKKLGDYEKTIGDRVALDQIQRQLSASGTTLEPTQQSDLLAIMSEERQRNNVVSTMGNDAVGESKILQDEASTEKWLASQQEMNRRVVDRARTVLSADQLVAFEAAQKQFLDMQKMGVQMSRAMFQKK